MAKTARKPSLDTVPSPVPHSSDLQDLPSHTLAAIVTAAAVGAAIQNGNGMLYGDSVGWLTLAVVMAAVGLAAPSTPTLQRAFAACIPFALTAGFIYAFYMWPFVRPALYVQAQSPDSHTLYTLCIGAAAVLCGLSLNSPRWLGRAHLPLLLAVYGMFGCWLLQSSPNPSVDVVTLHNEALRALLHGENPFAITWPNIYPDISHYPDGLVRDGRVLFGYDYPPINLLMAMPSYIFGDYRYALLIANAISGALIGRLKNNLALPLAALFLFTPRALLILENGWTEPFSVLFLLLTLWASIHRPKLIPFALGLLLASKQYVVLLMASAYHLPALREMRGDREALLGFWGRTLGTAAAVTLPFFLWSPKAFWFSVVQVPISHPFREDALTFLAWYRKTDGTLLPTYVGFVAAALASVAACLRLPRTLAGFAYSFGAIFLFFIAFNRQAFCNYYFLVIAAFYAAAALGRDPTDGLHAAK